MLELPPGIRRFAPADLERLKEITVECFEGVAIDHAIELLYGTLAGHDWKFRKSRHIDADATDPEGIFVYELDGAIAGYVTTRIDAVTKVGWIPNIATDPRFRGRGIGRALMQTALDRLKSSGMVAVKIETLEQNEIGRTFYPGMGFVEVARQIHYAMKLDGPEESS